MIEEARIIDNRLLYKTNFLHKINGTRLIALLFCFTLTALTLYLSRVLIQAQTMTKTHGGCDVLQSMNNLDPYQITIFRKANAYNQIEREGTT